MKAQKFVLIAVILFALSLTSSCTSDDNVEELYDNEQAIRKDEIKDQDVD